MIIYGSDYLCAAQTLKPGPSAAELDEFMREAAIMAQFNHRNVVSLVGVITIGEPRMILCVRACVRACVCACVFTFY